MLFEEPVTLWGFGLEIRRLFPTDGPALYRLYDADTSRYIISWFPGADEASFCVQLDDLIKQPNEYFTVLWDGQIVGTTSYRRYEPANKRIEIGATWYGPGFKGTRVNPACKLLMLEYAFETLVVNRVEFVVDARNERSRRAVVGIGGKEEGILRRHVVCPDGFVRDSVFFSILREEWPAVRANLEARINPAAANPSP
jgi:RimJ/RimL family protein N-acetyltransferase